MHPDAKRWNRKYRDASEAPRFEVEPAFEALSDRFGIPGRALELACGRGAHTLWLAQRGWRVCGLDVSVEGIRIARAESRRRGLTVQWVVADAARLPLAAHARFDLVVVTRFLDRSLFGWIPGALAPGGRVFYLTFNRGRLVRHPGFNPRFLLAPGELPAAFPALGVEEQAEAGDISWVLARRPA